MERESDVILCQLKIYFNIKNLKKEFELMVSEC